MVLSCLCSKDVCVNSQICQYIVSNEYKQYNTLCQYPKCKSAPGGMGSAQDQELLIHHLSRVASHTYLPPVRMFFSDGFSAVQGLHKCHKIQEERLGRVAVSQYRVVSYRERGEKKHSFTLSSNSLL